ncbi:MAG: sensor histidine kinase [Chloroflexi bacterium]|nr:sensor histidine kinase [Chloroflexota bacterium]
MEGTTDAICAFFLSHMVVVYFLYGLGFFITGVAVWLEASRRSVLPLAQALPLLAAFGFVHGGHEWVEMFQLVGYDTSLLLSSFIRLPVLAISFILLVEFGLRLLALNGWRHWRLGRWILLSAFFLGEGVVWATWGGQDGWLAAADAWCRYSLAVPGAVLAAAGLFRQSRRLLPQQASISRDLLIVGLAFLAYGIPGQVFVGPSPLPPSTVVNTTLFLETFHFPVQLLRTAVAGTVAIFTVRALRLFEFERQRQVNELSQARAEAQQQLTEEMAEREKLRRELLHQAVLAQEEERQHIARELHDEASQAMTALSWKLAAVEQVLPDSHSEGHEKIHRRIKELRQLTEQVMNNLRQLTTRLRPAVLDELGLVPALIAYADDCSSHFPFIVDVEITGQRRRLLPEIETTLYRIAQEAITNVAKHAQATHASIRLYFDEQEIALSISDDGVGMDVEVAQRAAACGKGWGLAGICERVQLVEGHLNIRSTPGEGTNLTVRVPIPHSLSPEEETTHETDPVTFGG